MLWDTPPKQVYMYIAAQVRKKIETKCETIIFFF